MTDKYTHQSAYLWLDATGCRRVRTIKASQRRSTPIDTQEGPRDPGLFRLTVAGAPPRAAPLPTAIAAYPPPRIGRTSGSRSASPGYSSAAAPTWRVALERGSMHRDVAQGSIGRQGAADRLAVLAH